MSALRLGLFGGSFDPVHGGHLHVAEAAQRAFGLDRVVFVPAVQPPHKPARRLAPAADRLAMIRLALAGRPGWSVHDLELRRPGPSYTIDTVRALPDALGLAQAELFLLIGGDNLAGLAGWKDARALLERVQPVVVRRDAELESELAHLARRLAPALVEKLRGGILDLPPVAVGASDLRERLARGAATGADELPTAVGEYIRVRGLYRFIP